MNVETPAPYPMRPHLERLLLGEDLAPAAAREAMEAVVAGRMTPASLAAFLIALRNKGESEAEIAAFAAVLREKSIHIRAPAGSLDTCGTGGDASWTFNISTAVALIAAGMGIPVAKHGNRSASSQCGSADVLKFIGVNIEAPPAVMERCLAEAGIAFLFAPNLHPGLRHAGPVRRELGVRTVFNLLGPLANPAQARRQLLGVFEPRWCETFARVLLKLGSEAALVVCGTGLGGQGHLDEISTWGANTLAWLQDGAVRVETFEAATLGFHAPPPETLRADGVETSARMLREVLGGRPGPARDIVVLNAAAAAQVAGRAESWEEGLALAAESLDQGKARAALEKLIAVSNRT